MRTARRFSAEVRERAVRPVRDHQAEYATHWGAITSIAGKIGCAAETLRLWVRRAERDSGQRPGLTSDGQQRLKLLEREGSPPHSSESRGASVSRSLPRQCSRRCSLDRSGDSTFASSRGQRQPSNPQSKMKPAPSRASMQTAMEFSA
jgi:transposase